MRQCTINMAAIVIAALSTNHVVSTGAPVRSIPSMLLNMRDAVPKSRARKITHVMLTKKYVNSASAIFAGSVRQIARCPSRPVRKRSALKYNPCNPPQTTNVQAAPCQSPPRSIVVIRLP
jgi:hypothetical protein